MNKRNAIKELKKIQKVEQELNVRIDNLENEVIEKEQINEEQKKINEEQKKIIEEQEVAISDLKEETKDIRKVQEQQGIDIAALAKAINSLNDTKIKFEDEYADWEDKYNQLAKIAEENPRLKEGINLEVMKRGMENAMKSTKFIDEKLNKIYKLAVEIQNFEEYNYQNI